MTGSVRMYGGVSAEQRRAERRRRLLAAGLELIGTVGLSGTTFRALCERARVGPRFFYESFPDVESVAVALYDEIAEETLAAARTALADAPMELPERLRVAVQTFMHRLLDDPRVARLVFAETPRSTVLLQRRFEFMRQVTDMAVEQDRLLFDLPAEGLAIEQAVARLVVGGAAELVTAWLDGHIAIDREQLIALVTDHAQQSVQRLPAMVESLRRA